MVQENNHKKRLTYFFNKKLLRIFNKLVKNSLWVLFIFSGLMMLLYIMGNYYNFLDKTQILILRVMSISAVLLVIFSLLTFLGTFIYIFFAKYKFLRFVTIFFSIICFISGSLLFLYATLINHLSSGL